jgi:serine protease inhibitor ecotin
MAKRLKGMGHDIQTIDQAPRSNFNITTIYFAPNSKYEAKRLMSTLGEKFLLKPLSWSSKFDLIVVTVSSN